MPILHTLHGFLGHHSNWNQFPLDICSHNLYKEPLLADLDGFWGWAKRFNNYVKDDKPILMGYSLGARLAMHALLENPNKWSAAILISSDMGLTSEEEKKRRLLNDEEWARKFESENFNEVLELWDQQEVFNGIKNPLQRNLNSYEKRQVVSMMRTFSKGLQENLREDLKKIKLPILWIGGDKDVHFKMAANEINFQNAKSQIKIVKDSGHRLPWEKPEEFVTLVNVFLKEVKP